MKRYTLLLVALPFLGCATVGSMQQVEAEIGRLHGEIGTQQQVLISQERQIMLLKDSIQTLSAQSREHRQIVKDLKGRLSLLCNKVRGACN